MLFHLELSEEVCSLHLHLKRFVRPSKLNSHLPRLIIMAMIIIQIVSVNFHPHYGSITKKKKYHGNKLSIINLAEDIYSQDEENIKKVGSIFN